MLRHPTRWIGLVPILGLVAGCAGLPGQTTAGFSPDMEGPEAIAPQQSIVDLPAVLEDGRIAVWRKVDKTVLSERVVLANNTAIRGENEIQVQTRHRGMPYFRFFSGPLKNPFTVSTVASRVEEEFDGFEQISRPIDRVNGYGPYRYIAASDDDIACVFAWQLIDSTARVTGSMNTYAVDFRYCATGDEPGRLISLFDDIRLQPHL